MKNGKIGLDAKKINPFRTYRMSQTINFACLEGCELESMQTIFKIRLLIYYSKANVDEKMLLGKTIHL